MRRTVAVIDNDFSVLAGFRRMLNASGIDTETFSSAEEYLAKRATSSAVCLIVDIHLIGISGLELRHRLAAMGSTLPVLFMTGRDDAYTRREARGAGCAAYLCKPVARHTILSAIEAALSSPDSSI